MDVVAWIGLAQSLFAALLMITKKEPSISDRVLAAWLILLAISFLFSGIEIEIHQQSILANSFLLINPAFFIYIRSLTDPVFRLRWIQLLHLLPYVLFEAGALSATLPRILANTTPEMAYIIAFVLIASISTLLYNLVSIRRVHAHRLNLENEFSKIERNLRLGWILFILISYIIFTSTVLILAAAHIHELQESFEGARGTLEGFLALTFILSFYGLRQQRIYKQNGNAEPRPKYHASLLSAARKQEIHQLLLDHFNSRQPYLDPDLSMDLLSEKLGVPKHQITEVLSTLEGKNFFTFVNAYRIEAVKEQLADPSNLYSIDAIAYECGFNSKSSFYTVFKRLTKQTPLQYRQSILQD